MQKKIKGGRIYDFFVTKSANKYITRNTIFIENEDNFIDNFSVTSDFFNNKDTLRVSFSYKLKYVGILQKCNNITNTTIDGFFTIKHNITDDTYSLISYTITDITYNPNDFCGTELSPYYGYDVYCDNSDELDDDDCIESNIWNVFNDMFDSATVSLNNNIIVTTFTASNFHTKIKNIIGTYSYGYINEDSIINLVFNTKSVTNLLVHRTSSNGLLPIIHTEGVVSIKYTLIGDTIKVSYLNENTVIVSIESILSDNYS